MADVGTYCNAWVDNRIPMVLDRRREIMIDQEIIKSMLLEITGYNWYKNPDGEIRCDNPDDTVRHCPLSAIAETRNLPPPFFEKWYLGNAIDVAEALGLSYEDITQIMGAADNVAPQDCKWLRQMMESILLSEGERL